MKLWLLSDLHLDHGNEWPRPPAEADVAVVAGDVCDDRWLEETAALLPTVFVAGNHEFYRHEVAERKAKLAAIQNLAFLDDSDFFQLFLDERGAARFVGATLWTDYAKGNALAMRTARDSMNDHRLIKWKKEPWQRFTPTEALALHRRSVEFLRGSLCDNNPPGMPTVVVTHHAPSLSSVSPRFRAAGPINHAYASDLDYLVEGSGAAIWVHGHVHDATEYMIGDTRVICNPHGYPSEVGKNGFRPDLIVEVGNG